LEAASFIAAIVPFRASRISFFTPYPELAGVVFYPFAQPSLDFSDSGGYI
jgi:hypothetical protein